MFLQWCNVFSFYHFNFVYKYVAMYDLVHNVETVLTANSIWKFCLKCE